MCMPELEADVECELEEVLVEVVEEMRSSADLYASNAVLTTLNISVAR